MLPYARWTNALALPLLALTAGAAWYLSRSTLSLLLMDGGHAASEVGTAFTVGAVASIFGLLFGGLGALAVTPWVTATVGLCVAALGLLLIGFGPASLLPVSMALASFGRGMITPSIYGALARALDGPRGGLRDAAFVATYAFVNLGALSSTLTSSVDMFHYRPRLPILVGVALLALSVVIAAVIGGVSFAGREKDAPKPAFRGSQLLAIAGLIAVIALPLSMSYQAFALVAQVDIDYEQRALLFAANPMTVFGAGLLVAGGLAVLHLAKVRLPTLLPIGIGAVITGGGLLALLVTTGDEPSVVGIVLALVVGGVGEVLVSPLVASRVAGDLPYRLGTLAVALFLIAVQLPDLLLRPFVDGDELVRPLGWVGVVSGLVIGLAVAAAAYPTRRFFEPPSPEDAEKPAEF